MDMIGFWVPWRLFDAHTQHHWHRAPSALRATEWRGRLRAATRSPAATARRVQSRVPTLDRRSMAFANAMLRRVAWRGDRHTGDLGR
eukprot:4214262-Prymnesium_polylepis.2